MEKELAGSIVLKVADHPQQVYAGRTEKEDSSYVDTAACARKDGDGLLVVYYRTTAEYVRNYSLSYQNCVQGYNPAVDGIIVVTRGDRIVASNDHLSAGYHRGRKPHPFCLKSAQHRRRYDPCAQHHRAAVRLRYCGAGTQLLYLCLPPGAGGVCLYHAQCEHGGLCLHGRAVPFAIAARQDCPALPGAAAAPGAGVPEDPQGGCAEGRERKPCQDRVFAAHEPTISAPPSTAPG